ncbi:MAG: DUF3109 family protein [Chitinophagaceae bacterium]|nr:DUF3109 family protein [Chitinophagaceae bacterium]
MIAIGNKWVSDAIVEEHFVCDLNACKGHCCVEGEAGAILENEELQYLEEIYPLIKPYLTEEGKNKIRKTGGYIMNSQFGWVTPTLVNGMCAYGTVDKNGTVKCAIQQAFKEGKFKIKNGWQKPISCHLFPIQVKKVNGKEFITFEPRKRLCDPGCELGKKLKIPVYEYLKEPIINRFGPDFYEALHQSANYLKKTKKN